MTGTLATLLLHRGGSMQWGASPAIYQLLLSAIAAIRMARRGGRPAVTLSLLELKRTASACAVIARLYLRPLHAMINTVAPDWADSLAIPS